MVIRMIATFSMTSRATGSPVSRTTSVSGFAKLSAANAEDRKPASVIATWIVERNFAGSTVSRSSLSARLLPSSLSLRSFASPTCSTAISAQEKSPLIRISTISSNNRPTINSLTTLRVALHNVPVPSLNGTYLITISQRAQKYKPLLTYSGSGRGPGGHQMVYFSYMACR